MQKLTVEQKKKVCEQLAKGTEVRLLVHGCWERCSADRSNFYLIDHAEGYSIELEPVIIKTRTQAYGSGVENGFIRLHVGAENAGKVFDVVMTEVIR